MCFHSAFYKESRGIMYSFGEMSCVPLWERNCKCQATSLCNQPTGTQRDSHGRRLELGAVQKSHLRLPRLRPPGPEKQTDGEKKPIREEEGCARREPGGTPEVETSPAESTQSRLSRCSHSSLAQTPGASMHWMLTELCKGMCMGATWRC